MHPNDETQRNNLRYHTKHQKHCSMKKTTQLSLTLTLTLTPKGGFLVRFTGNPTRPPISISLNRSSTDEPFPPTKAPLNGLLVSRRAPSARPALEVAAAALAPCAACPCACDCDCCPTLRWGSAVVDDTAAKADEADEAKALALRSSATATHTPAFVT